MSLLGELRRRNVIRVALAYAVIAWFIVQAADILLGNFGAPAWVFKTLTSLLALGFPLVLFLSWAYDLTPEGLRKTADADAENPAPAAPGIDRGVRRALFAGLAAMALTAAWWTFREEAAPAAAGMDGLRQVSQPPVNTAGGVGSPPSLRLSIPMAEGHEVTGPIAISRDGRQVAFVSTDAQGEAHVYLRRLDDFVPARVEGSRDGYAPFFSPDGSAIGFFAGNTIWRAATSGGPSTALHRASALNGADWMDDDTIVYSEAVGSPIRRITADGVAMDPITALGDGGHYAHVWPQQIPGTTQMLFMAWGQSNLGGAHIADLASGVVRPISPDPDTPSQPARWSASGHLLFEALDDGLFATRFDPASPSTTLGAARFLLGGVHHLGGATRSVFALSQEGTLAYVPAVQNNRALVRLRADGVVETILDQNAVDYARIDRDIALSRDGRLALIGTGEIMLVDLARKLPRRLVNDGNDLGPAWSVDERAVYFMSNREQRWKIWKRALDGDTAPVIAVEHALNINRFSIGPAGEIVFSVTDPVTGSDLWISNSAGTQRAIVQSKFNETAPALSPDGQLLAYVSDVSGLQDVYLLPASGNGLPEQISTGGGRWPKWSADGRVLMFRKGREIWQVAMEDGRPMGEATQRSKARNLALGNAYALAADGESLYGVQLGDGAIPREIRVITGFFDEIRRLTEAEKLP